jgi:hypothetical protein
LPVDSIFIQAIERGDEAECGEEAWRPGRAVVGWHALAHSELAPFYLKICRPSIDPAAAEQRDELATPHVFP